MSNQQNLLPHFRYKHLPDHLQKVSMQFHELATYLELMLNDCSEKTVALRKLLEAKDCAVRAATYQDGGYYNA